MSDSKTLILKTDVILHELTNVLLWNIVKNKIHVPYNELILRIVPENSQVHP